MAVCWFQLQVAYHAFPKSNIEKGPEGDSTYTHTLYLPDRLEHLCLYSLVGVQIPFLFFCNTVLWSRM